VAVVDRDPRSGAHHRRVTERMGQVGGQPVDEAVAVRGLDPLVVVIERPDQFDLLANSSVSGGVGSLAQTVCFVTVLSRVLDRLATD
jgi:hypothetical protein